MAARCSSRIVQAFGAARPGAAPRPLPLALLLLCATGPGPAAIQEASTAPDASPQAPPGSEPGGGPESAEGASSAEEFAQRRRDIEAEMQRLRAQMERFDTQERSLLARVERLRLEAHLREQEAEAADLESRRLERAIDRLTFQIARVSERIDRQRLALGARLRTLYRRGPLGPVRALSRRADSAEWVRAVGLLELLARRDAAAIASLRADSEELSGALVQKRQALRQRDEEHRRAEESRAALAQAVREEQALLEAVRNDRDTHRAAYEELVTAARELDALIERVRGGTETAGGEAAWASLGPFRGLLSWPVEGPIRVPFGDVRHPRFGTLTPHRGLTFEASAGAPVRAVFEGEVAFQDWLQGYGHTIIVDHHHGYLSVYAHLGQPEVRAGQRVARGGVLGSVGDSGSLEGPQLYFELRRDGLPLDPEPWLAPGPQRAGRTGGHP